MTAVEARLAAHRLALRTTDPSLQHHLLQMAAEVERSRNPEVIDAIEAMFKADETRRHH